MFGKAIKILESSLELSWILEKWFKYDKMKQGQVQDKGHYYISQLHS